MLWRRGVFVVLALFCLSPLCPPAGALILGIALAFTIGNPFAQLNGRPTRLVSEGSIVLLGFGTDLSGLYGSLRASWPFVLLGAAVMVAFAYLLGRLPRPTGAGPVSYLHNNAAEQGSPINAVVFVFSTAALLIFPFIAHWLSLDMRESAAWLTLFVFLAPMAMGAALTLGIDVLFATAPLVLIRVLLVYAAGLAINRDSGDQDGRAVFPWFVLGFIAVVIARTFAPLFIFPSVFDALVNLAKAGIVLSLFLTGAAITPELLQTLRSRTAVASVVVWAALSGVSLAAIVRLIY